MRNRKQKFKRIQREISEILRKVWDPIGINDAPEARDEYDSYVWKVYLLLRIKAPDGLIYAYLRFVESILMGISKPSSNIKNTIRKLKEVDFQKE